MSPTLQDLGEQALLSYLQAFSPPHLTGDDAAVLSCPSADDCVISTDMMVEGVHFSEQTTTGFDVGWRAAAANLSDIAAMGARPTGITIALGLPGSTTLDWILALYDGISACLAPWETPIVGGDVCRSPVKTISITIFGRVPPGKALYRRGAQVGDWIIATGEHGAARAGLECLLNPQDAANLELQRRQAWQTAHQRPNPRLDLVPSLQALPQRGAAMDSSDGLGDAVLQICRASGVGAELWTEHLPIPKGLKDWVGPTTAIAWTLYGGEDFELVLTLPETLAPFWLSKIQEEFPLPANRLPRPIGRITASPAVCLTAKGQPTETLSLHRGFQHFSPPS